MDKKPDFAMDLSSLTESVETDVGDVLHALATQKKKLPLASAPPRQPPVSPVDTKTTSAVEPHAAVPSEREHSEQRRTSRSAKNKQVRQLADDVVLENVTTRLRRETNELLTEAALRQRLKKTDPATRQDIVEAALRDWFKKEGYER